VAHAMKAPKILSAARKGQKVIGADCPKCGDSLWAVPCARCSDEHYHCDTCKCEWVWQKIMGEWVRYSRDGQVVEVIPARVLGTMTGLGVRRRKSAGA